MKNILFDNSIVLNGVRQNQNVLLLNPKFSLEWQVNNSNMFIASFTRSSKALDLHDIKNNYILNSLTNFERGTNKVDILSKSSILLSYSLGDWNKSYFASFNVSYSKYDKFKSYNLALTPNYVLSDRLILDDSEFWIGSTKFDYFFESISSNLRVDLGLSISDYQNIISGSNLRNIKSSSYDYGFELKSGFDGLFNYHFGTKWSYNKIDTDIDNSFTNNKSFLDLLFAFNDRFDLQIKTERFFIDNLSNDSESYYFLDVDARYVLIENKLNLFFDIKNLFNTDRFINNYINNTGFSRTDYRLLPRFLVFKMEYRF